jgi:hypothetical protein
VQQASQQPQAAIKRDQEESENLGPKFVQESTDLPNLTFHDILKSKILEYNSILSVTDLATGHKFICSGKLNYA